MEKLPSGLRSVVIDAPARSSRPTVVARSKPVRAAAPPSLRALFFGTRRQIVTILVAVVIALLSALLFLAAVPPRFSASAVLLIDTQRSRSPIDAPNSAIDSSAVASQLETLKSETLARTVIAKLGLDDDPEFAKSGLVIEWLARLAPGLMSPSESPQRRQRQVVERFVNALDVFLAGRSYAAVVRFSSTNPEKAARIANAIADTYIDDQLEAKSEGSNRANQWFQNRLDELRSQADASAKELDDFTRQSADLPDAARRARLDELTANAQARRRAFENFQSLSHYSRAIEQQALPTTEARILSWAQAPLVRSWPPIGLTLALAAAAGAGLGTLLAYAREHLVGKVRSRQALERDLDLRCLGFLPRLARRWRRKSMRVWHGRSAPRGMMIAGDRDPPCASEALIGLRIALDACRTSPGDAVIVGLVSPRSGEGKTTLAFNLAKSMADSGARVLLVDADLHESTLTRELDPEAQRGLFEAIDGAFDLSELESVSGLGVHLLGASRGQLCRRPADLLGSRRARDFFAAARSAFDYVVVDFPAALDHIDACAAADGIDLFVLVAEWGRTKLADLEAMSARCDRIAERTIGAFVNKVPRGAGWF